MPKLLLLLVFSATLRGQPAELAIQSAEREFASALTRADVAALDRLLSADLSYGHASGKLDTKPTYIDRIRTGAQKYVSFQPDPQPPTIHVYGTTATAVASAEIASVTDGQPNSLHLRFLHVWVREKGGWKLVAHQSVRLQP